MTYDLVVRNGTVIDGTGAPRRQADVAVKDGRIAEIGKVRAHWQFYRDRRPDSYGDISQDVL